MFAQQKMRGMFVAAVPPQYTPYDGETREAHPANGNCVCRIP